MQSWQQPRCPTLVHNTGGLNVVQAACGTRHAALISRAGDLYTWGYGRGGCRGLRWHTQPLEGAPQGGGQWGEGEKDVEGLVWGSARL